MTADDVIRLLGLVPHPEGGHYRETFRDPATHDGRAVSTAIYFLLAAGERSRWHRVDAAETWHWYGGAPLLLSLQVGDEAARVLRLGCNLSTGERPQIVVPRGAWQQAESTGAYTLVGCTVAPGFTFDGFEMAAPDFDPQPGNTAS